MATCLIFCAPAREARKAAGATRVEALVRLAAVQGKPCPR